MIIMAMAAAHGVTRGIAIDYPRASRPAFRMLQTVTAVAMFTVYRVPSNVLGKNASKLSCRRACRVEAIEPMMQIVYAINSFPRMAPSFKAGGTVVIATVNRVPSNVLGESASNWMCPRAFCIKAIRSKPVICVGVHISVMMFLCYMHVKNALRKHVVIHCRQS